MTNDPATYLNENRTPNNTKPLVEKYKKENKKRKKTKKHKNKVIENKNENTKNNEHLNIMYTNVDTLSNKLNELQCHADIYKADIILIAEYLSKNPSSKYENVFNLDNYNCFEDSSGRGVCVFYKKHLNITKNDMVSELYNPSIFFNVKTNSKPFNIGLVYRSPNNDEKENKKLINQLNFATKKLKNLFIFGDFNHPYIDWEHNYCKKNEDHCDSVFLFEVNKLNLNQLVTQPTHHKPNCKSSLIDLVLTKVSDLIMNIKYHPPLGMSHHQVITACIRNNCSFIDDCTKNNVKIIKPNFDKANYTCINNYFQDIDWDAELNDKNVNDTWDTIKDKIQHAQHTYVPVKIINSHKKRTNPVPMDDTLHFLLKDKRYLFKRYKKCKTTLNFLNYNLARSKVSKRIKLMKKNKENKIAKEIKHNPKAFYQYIASKTVKKEGVAELVNAEGKLTSDDEEKSNIVNDFFGTVFTQEDISTVPDFTCDQNIDTCLENCTITIQDMVSALNNLNSNKSPGPDNIHPKFLKSSSKSLAKPLTLLFNKTLSEGCIPDEWKLAEVRPIYKKGDKTQPGNYRPVSLTSVICKVMESFIKKSLNSHLINNNLLSCNQFGFVSGRNTITQLLVSLNDWMYDLDSNIPVDACYMDFRKAFDAVPHQRLINKLKGYNISGPILKWITSFLTNRKQFVKINNSVSNSLNVTSGVPQGSVLGPTLFIYFINDLPNVVKSSKVKIFADDTKVYNSIKNPDNVKCLQNSIDEMFLWTQKWLLKFNKDKCKVLHLGKNNPKNKYFIGSENERVELEETDLEKDLGIFIDPNLDFKKHIKSIVKKASFLSYKILKNFTYRDSNILIPLFKSLIRPILEYGNSVWTNGLKKYRNLVENVQRKFTKHIKGLNEIAYEDRLSKIKLPSLEYRQHRGDMIQVFKIANNFYDPATTNTIFQFNRNSKLRGHDLKIVKQRVNKTKFASFFSNRVVNSWNKLPNFIVNSKSINEFKNSFDEYNKNIMYKIDI